MPRKIRKTIDLEIFKGRVNNYLAMTPHGPTGGQRYKDFRIGAAHALESALHLAHAYKGFRYLETWEDHTTDESRREYY